MEGKFRSSETTVFRNFISLSLNTLSLSMALKKAFFIMWKRRVRSSAEYLQGDQFSWSNEPLISHVSTIKEVQSRYSFEWVSHLPSTPIETRAFKNGLREATALANLSTGAEIEHLLWRSRKNCLPQRGNFNCSSTTMSEKLCSWFLKLDLSTWKVSHISDSRPLFSSNSFSGWLKPL